MPFGFVRRVRPGTPVPLVIAALLLGAAMPAQQRDHFLTVRAHVTISAPSGSETIVLAGPATITVDLQHLADANGNGREEAGTEITEFALAGTSRLLGPVTLVLREATQRPFERSTGEIEETGNDILGILELPPFVVFGTGASFFDAFLVLEAGGRKLHNEAPLHLQATITKVPPAQGDVYSSPLGTIPLLDEQGNTSGLAITSSQLALDALTCDINLDGHVDLGDFNSMFAARNTPSSPDDPRDVNENGRVDVNDVRVCVLQASCGNKGTQVLSNKGNTGEGCTKQEARQNARDKIGSSCTEITCQGICKAPATCEKTTSDRAGVTSTCTEVDLPGCRDRKGFSCEVTGGNRSFDCICRCR